MSNKINDELADKAMEIVDTVLTQQVWTVSKKVRENLYQQTFDRLMEREP